MAVMDFANSLENQHFKINDVNGSVHRSHFRLYIGIEFLFRCVVIQTRESIF